MGGKHPPVGLTTDAVISIAFYSARPRLLVGRRAKAPFMDKLVFPGGHFDAGVWSDLHRQYIGNNDIPFDPSLRITTSRESAEEVHANIYPWQWKLLTELDAPDRDPRTDMRRVSLAYWMNLEYLPESIQADDDLIDFEVVDLMSLTEEAMGFDHWRVVEILQELWQSYALIWINHPDLGWVHSCDEIQGVYAPNGEPHIVHILHGDDKPRIIIQAGEEQLELAGMTMTCPHCGADLSLPPPEPLTNE